MRRLLMLVAMMVLGMSAACGSTSCSDACQSLIGCLDKLNANTTLLDVSTCTSQCNAGTCTNKQQLIDCVHGTSCNSTSNAYDTAISACQMQSSCSIGL
jgi:hypothetical protein